MCMEIFTIFKIRRSVTRYYRIFILKHQFFMSKLVLKICNLKTTIHIQTYNITRIGYVKGVFIIYLHILVHISQRLQLYTV